MSNDENASIVICRTCMSECIERKSIHKKGLIMTEVTTLAKILRQITNLEFPEAEENLPTEICLKCFQSLTKAYIFRKKAIKTNTSLRQYSELCGDNKPSVRTSSDDSRNYRNEVTKHLRHSMEAQNKNHSENIEFISNDLEGGSEFVTVIDATSDDIDMEEYPSDNETQSVLQQQQESQYEIHHLQEVVVDEVVDESDFNEISVVEEVSEDGVESELSIVKIEHTIEAYEISLDASENQSNDVNDEGYEMEYFKEVTSENGQDQQHPQFSLRKQPLSNVMLGLNIADKIVHTRKSNPTREKNPDFQCKICKKQLSNAGSYKYHMQLHSDKTPFLCSLCGEGFKTRNAYDGHMSVHDPNNPNTCHVCGKTYRQPSSLRTHMLAHTGEKPFQCEICGKGLTQKSGYKKHMLTHTDEKPHECDICGREFRYSSNLLAHKKIHNALKEYKCTNCPKCFYTNEQLRRHMQTHNQEFSHICDLCPRRFRRRLSMMAHRNAEHEEDSYESKLSKSNVVEML